MSSRLFLAGFALPDNIDGVALQSGYVFVSPTATQEASDDWGQPSGHHPCEEISCEEVKSAPLELPSRQLLPLFRGCNRKNGVHAGPRLVLEYHVGGV